MIYIVMIGTDRPVTHGSCAKSYRITSPTLDIALGVNSMGQSVYTFWVAASFSIHVSNAPLVLQSSEASYKATRKMGKWMDLRHRYTGELGYGTGGENHATVGTRVSKTY